MASEYTAQAPKPRRRIVSMDDREEIVRRVLADVDKVRDDRSDWIERRLARYSKIRGFMTRSNMPWDNASDQNLGISEANALRVIAGLQNAVLANRPLINSRPLQPTHRDVAERNDHLLDYQFFVEGDGERMLEQYCIQFVEDGTVVSFQPRVVEKSHVYDIRVVPTPTHSLTDMSAMRTAAG